MKMELSVVIVELVELLESFQPAKFDKRGFYSFDITTVFDLNSFNMSTL
jgi:hypothetical protein